MITINIMGLGHIGLPLALKLKSNYSVMGSVREVSNQRTDLTTYLYQSPGQLPDDIDAEITILTIPPSGLDLDHLPKIKTKWLIYTSSISVYGTHQGTVSEDSACLPDSESGEKILKIENWVQSFPQWTVLRLGGLIGEKRHPGYYLAGKKNLSHPNAPVNLIHHLDVINCIEKIIKNNKSNEIYNLVCDEHRSREQFYKEFSKTHQLELPEFKNENTNDYKLVLNDKIKQHLGIEFIYSELIRKFS